MTNVKTQALWWVLEFRRSINYTLQLSCPFITKFFLLFQTLIRLNEFYTDIQTSKQYLLWENIAIKLQGIVCDSSGVHSSKGSRGQILISKTLHQSKIVKK